MRLLQQFATLAVSCLFLILGADAHSKSRNPLNYLSLLENPRIHTPSQRVHVSSHFDLTFDLHRSSEHIRLSLEPNHDIVHEDSYIEYLDQDGNVKHAEKMQREDYKVYQGKSFLVDEDGLSTNVGWARIVVRRDGIRPLFEGAFTVMGNHHHIQMKSTYTATKHLLDPELDDDEDEYMAVWRDSDVSRQSRRDLKRDAGLTCASDRLAFNTDPAHPIFQDLVLKRDDGYWGSMTLTNLLGKRQSIDGGGAGNGNSAGVSLKSTIGSTAGCPTTRKVALIGAATDCTYTASFNSTDTVRQHIITQVNTASDLYQSTFNITLGLRNMTVSDAACPGTASSTTPWNLDCTGNNQTMDSRLNLFSAWRGERGDSNAYWSLFTTCSTDAEVGVAWLGQLCNTGSTSQQDTTGTTQSVTGANVVAKTSTEWQVFAHESGHTFGAVHDCDSSTCADANTVNSGQCCPLSSSTCDANAQYMMNPYASSSINAFSPCSVGNICSALGRNSVQSGCLTDNKGVVTITGNQCGNGIVEEGEDCDCGGTEGCAGNTCCDATTCKFNSGAVCDPSNEGCCTTTCQFSSSGTVCRASTGSCDPQEVCSGTNGTCPADSTAKDGTSCTSGNSTGLACASGQCTSRNLQCKTLMGSYTSDNDTYACDSGSCTISCASPSFGANVCYSMQQNFLDGTPCNGDGKCENGVCSGSTVGGEVKSWIDNNKTLVIALASALGGIILLAILGCCVRACRRRKQPKYNGSGRRRGPAAATSAPRGWDGPAVPPQMRARQYGNSWQASPMQTQQPQQEWAPPQPSMMRSDQNWYPSTPPPAYAAWVTGARPKPPNSVRYA